MGITIARIDMTVEKMSSAMLTGTFPTPPVAAVTAGRTATDLTACTLPEISSPQINASTGWTSVITLALAAKATAPAAGRIKVCMASLRWLTAGILSASISMMTKIPSTINTQGFASKSQGSLSVNQSV